MTRCQHSWNTGYDARLVLESFKRCIVAGAHDPPAITNNNNNNNNNNTNNNNGDN